MNSWVKYASLAVTTILFIDCNASKNTHFVSPKIQKIDSLPATIIPSEKEQKNSISSTDTTSKIRLEPIDLLSYLSKNNKSETAQFNSEKGIIFKIQGLPHIKIKDLKNAVDDFGNINYLTPDF